MKHVSLDSLIERGGVIITETPILTQEVLIEEVAKMFDRHKNDSYNTVHWIERGPEWVLRLRSTNNSVLEPIVGLLNDLGVKTTHQIGCVMDALGLSRQELHSFACYCLDDEILGDDAAKRLRRVLNQSRANAKYVAA